MNCRILKPVLLRAAACCVVFIGSVGAASDSYAQTTNAVADGNWSTPATWDNGEPDGLTAAIVDGGNSVAVDQAGELANFLDVGSTSGSSGSLNVTGGDLTTSPDATGAVQRSTISIAHEAGSTGSMTVSGGSITVERGTGIDVGWSNDFIVGDNGTGALTQTGGVISAGHEVAIGLGATGVGTVDISGGTLTAEGLNVLVGFGGQGTLNVSGAATVSSATADMYVGFLEGSSGTVNQSGGTIETNFLFTNSFASGAGNIAAITQTGGVYTARAAYVLGQAAGTTVFNHSGGIVEVTGGGAFVVGDGNGNTSTYNVSGSAAVNVVNDVFVGTFEGATGIVNQTGGVITAGRNYRIGADGVGDWNISGGLLSGKNIFLGDFDTSFGTLRVSGGNVDLSGNLSVGGALASNAPPNPTGTQGQAFDANGVLVVSGAGGAINVGGDLLANPHDNSRVDGVTGERNDGTLVFQVLDSTGVSTIDVTGDAKLNGALIDFDLLGGSFGVGSTFDLVTAASISNDYVQAGADIGLYSLAIVTGGNGQILQATVVPEPTSLALCALGLVALCGGKARRRQELTA